MSLASNAENIVLHPDIDVLRIYSRQIRRNDEISVGLVNVSGRRPVTASIARPALKSAIEKTVHLVLKKCHVMKWGPSNEIHGICSSIRIF
jgi:hypothetical protein